MYAERERESQEIERAPPHHHSFTSWHSEGLLHEEELVDEPPVVHPWLTEQAQKPTPDALVVVMDAVVPA